MDETKVNEILAAMAYNEKAYRAGVTLMNDFDEARSALKPGGYERLLEAMAFALEQLERDEALARFINSDDYTNIMVDRRGFMDHTAVFLATVEAAYVRWVSNRTGVRFTLGDFYDMPEGFKGDLQDVVMYVCRRL